MHSFTNSVWLRYPIALLLLTTSSQSLADKHGHKHHHPLDKQGQHREQTWEDASDIRYGDIPERYFTDNHRYLIGDYYDQQYRNGHCPPGLSKKHNGCLPPGHTKHWRIGQPLPRHVIYYDLPPMVVQQLGYPPAGHRFVRVASDILLIAIGSGMVIDAISDLNNR